MKILQVLNIRSGSPPICDVVVDIDGKERKLFGITMVMGSSGWRPSTSDIQDSLFGWG